MATTSFGVNDALTNKRWSRILFEEALKATTFYNFMGTDADCVIQMKDDLQKNKGDKVTIGLRMQLKNDPTVGSATLRGREEQLVFYNDSLVIDLVRHGVLVTNADMTRQRVPFDVRAEGKSGLQDYFEGLLDTWFFNQACCYTPQTLTGWTGLNTPPTVDASHHIWAGGTWDGGSVAADETITTAGGSNINLTKLTGFDQCVLLAKTATPYIRPAKMPNGKKYWLAILHPQQANDLRTNTNTGQWLDIAKALLQGGGEDLFEKDVLGLYHNVLLMEDVRVTNGVNSSTSTTAVTTVRRIPFMGAQAIEMAFGRDSAARGDKKSVPIFWREQMDDYEQQLGISANLIGGMKNAQFNSALFASIIYSTYSAI